MLKGKKVRSEYGVVITKPHSNEMYDHNEKVSDMMKKNILDAWKKELTRLNANLTNAELEDIDWDADAFDNESNEISNPILVKQQKGVMYCGYGTGYSVQDVSDTFEKELENMPNYQLDQDYDDMVDDQLVPELKDDLGRKIGLVGFNTPKTAKIFVD